MLTKFGMPQETVLDGDVFVEGIFSLYTSENTDCDTVNPFSVQVMEAVKWIYDQLNKNDFLGDIRIGKGLKHYSSKLYDKPYTNTVYEFTKMVG